MLRHTGSTRSVITGLAALLAAVVMTAGLTTAPAHSAITIHRTCEMETDHVVDLNVDGATYDLTGTCGHVRVLADDATVIAPTVRRLQVWGNGNTVRSKMVRKVAVAGRSNTVRPTAAEIVVIRGRNQRVHVEGLAEHTRIRTDGASFRAREAHDLVVAGDRNTARLRKVWSLRVTGDRNTVRVRRLGDRAVSGRGNSVRAGSRF